MKKVFLLSLSMIMALILLSVPLLFAGEKKIEKLMEAFDENGCSGCHIMGKDYNGPDLTLVTTYRSKDWIIDFILNTKKHYEDPVVKSMIKLFNLYMPDQGVEKEDAELIYEYLKYVAEQKT